MKPPHPVSIHGGHSGQFCSHAEDSLEAILLAYVAKGYPWVGITEHTPPVSSNFIYPDEKAAGMDIFSIRARFVEYMRTCRALQAKYHGDIRIFVGFETENCSGSIAYTQALTRTFGPDYIVGSAHHVKDIAFDYSKEHYQAACERCGGIDGLYLTYFDEQYEMIRALSPHVVGHFDIVRIFDPDYRSRLVNPPIWEKIVRNLALIKQLDLILDFNLRPLARGESEPYLSAPILDKAHAMGIDIVPGDDSHGVETIDAHMHTAIDMLQTAGVSTTWRTPVEIGR